MKLEILIAMVLMIPAFLVAGERNKLNNKRTYLVYLLISIIILSFGFYLRFNHGNEFLYAYIVSYMAILYLILEKILGLFFFKITKRYPELSIAPEKSMDIIYNLLVWTGTVILPFIIDQIIVQKFFNSFQ